MYIKLASGEYLIKTILISGLVSGLMAMGTSVLLIITGQFVGTAFTAILVGLAMGILTLLIAFIACIIVGIVISNLDWVSGNRVKVEILKFIGHLVFIAVVAIGFYNFHKELLQANGLIGHEVNFLPILLAGFLALSMFFVHWYTLPILFVENSPRKRKEKPKSQPE